MPINKVTEMHLRDLVVWSFDQSNKKYFNYVEDIFLYRRIMFNWIDNLLEYLSVLVSQKVYPAEVADEPKMIRELIKNSTQEFGICLANSVKDTVSLAEVLIIVDDGDFNNAWWRISDLVTHDILKMENLHLECLRVQEMFKEMAQRYQELCLI